MLIYLSFGPIAWSVIENKNHVKVLRNKFGKKAFGKIFFLMLTASTGYVEEVNDRAPEGNPP